MKSIMALFSSLVITGSLLVSAQESNQPFKFEKNGQRLCRGGSTGFFKIKCSNKSVGEEADKLSTGVDYCDVMIKGDSIIYKINYLLGMTVGTKYLTVKGDDNCSFVGAENKPTEKPRQTSVLTKENLKNVSIYGQSPDVQAAQIVIKTETGARWVMVHVSDTAGIPVVELRDQKNVKLVVDRYLLAKGNQVPYENLVGFRTMNCEKMASENHDVKDQIAKKNFNETCLQVVGSNRKDEYVSLAIIPASKLKNHLFRTLSIGFSDYQVEEEYSQYDLLLDLLTFIFGK